MPRFSHRARSHLLLRNTGTQAGNLPNSLRRGILLTRHGAAESLCKLPIKAFIFSWIHVDESRNQIRKRPAALSGRLALFFVFLQNWFRLKEAACTTSACSGKNCKIFNNLPRGRGSWPAQRTPCHVFHRVHSASRHIHDGMTAGCQALYASFPDLLRHVKAHNH